MKARREGVHRDHRLNDVREHIVKGCAAGKSLEVWLECRCAVGQVLVDEREEDRVLVGEVLERGGLPDARCTPGAVRIGVSLAMICRYGYSRSVRPPGGYTQELKLRQMRAYGFAGPAGAYEEDHLVALSIGGAPRDPANLWPEPRGGEDNAGQKDG